MYYQHMVQAGVGPYQQAGSVYTQPPSAVAAAVAAAQAAAGTLDMSGLKSDHIASSSHKHDLIGNGMSSGLTSAYPQQQPVQPNNAQNKTSVSAASVQAYIQTGGQFNSSQETIIASQHQQQIEKHQQQEHEQAEIILQPKEITDIASKANSTPLNDATTLQSVESQINQPTLLMTTSTTSTAASIQPSIVTPIVQSVNVSESLPSVQSSGNQIQSITTLADSKSQPKRLHVSNIPFRFRDPDLRAMFGFGTILDVEIIFNERGSKGFGFVTFANSADAERARERLHGTVVEGRKIEVNNATARVQTKKAATTVPQVCVQWPEGAAALRGAAIQRSAGRSRVAFPSLTGLPPGFPRLQAPSLSIGSAAALHGYPSVYYDPFLAAAQADPNYRMHQTPLSQAQHAYSAAAATYTAVAGMRAAAYSAAAATAPPSLPAGYAAAVAAAGYGREYADPYLGHGIGPVPGYGAAMYRGSYNRFTPY